MDGLSPNQFQGVPLSDISTVEDLLTFNILLDDISIVEKTMEELAKRSVQIHGETVQLLRYNKHISYKSDNNEVFQSFGCPNCDTFFKRASNLEQNITICCERAKHAFPTNVYQIRKTLYDKLDSFGITYTSY